MVGGVDCFTAFAKTFCGVAVAWPFSASLGLPINCGESIVNDVVSLDTAALVTNTSKRTLWRRLSAGKLQRHSMDERGRVMLALADISEHICLPFSADPARGGGSDFCAIGRGR